MQHLDALDAAIEANYAAKPVPPRQGYLGASANVGQCDRAAWYRAGGTTPDEPRSGASQRILDRGNALEPVILEALRRVVHIHERDDKTHKQHRWTQLNGLYSGGLDGLVTHAYDFTFAEWPAVWECKVVGENTFRKTYRRGPAAKPEWAEQVAQNQGAAHLVRQAGMLGLKGEPRPALFTIVHADTMQMRNFLVPFDEQRYTKCVNMAVRIVDHMRDNTTPPRGAARPDAHMCLFCDYKARCWNVEDKGRSGGAT